MTGSQILKHRDTEWVVEVNNPDKLGAEFEFENLKSYIEKEYPKVIYYCYGKEIGEKGTPHYHIYFITENGVYGAAVSKKFGSAHVEPRWRDISRTDCRNYMLKEGKWADLKGDTKIEGMQFESGTMPIEREGQGKRTDWHILYELILKGYTNAEIYAYNPCYIKYAGSLDRVRLDILGDKAKEQWRTLETTYIFGTTGAGKTKGVMEKYGYSNVYRVTNYTHGFDEYMGQDVVVFEEFRSSLKCSDMLNYLDGYPISLPSRYANRQALWTKVYLISNVPLEEQYPSVQGEQKETWAAFLRRIHSIMEYTPNGVFTYDSVEDYFARGDEDGEGEYPPQEPDNGPIQIPIMPLDTDGK